MPRFVALVLFLFAACGDDMQPAAPDAGAPDAMTVEGPGQLPPKCFPGWHLSPDRKSCVPNADAGT